jgi:hypothetical protein
MLIDGDKKNKTNNNAQNSNARNSQTPDKNGAEV